MTRPTNILVEFDDTVKSLNHLIKKFLRECKEEGIIREHMKQYVHETRGQKKRRLRREGKKRQRSNSKKSK